MSDFKADFVGFAQKPYKVGFLHICTYLQGRSILLAWKKKLTPQQKAEYKAEKREEMQNIFKKIDDGVKAVFESERYKECLRYMSKFTNYSAGNCILIMLQMPDASLVAAFGKWKELGRTVNKGEKA